MPAPAWNPFQNEELKLPVDDGWLKKLTKAGGGDSEAKEQDETEVAPFNRMVDGWLLAVALGWRFRDEEFAAYPPADHKFHTGAVLHGNTEVIQFLHHVALAELLRGGEFEAHEEDAAYEVIENPARVIRICNELAARGMPHLREMIEDGQLSTTANLVRSLTAELALEAGTEG